MYNFFYKRKVYKHIEYVFSLTKILSILCQESIFSLFKTAWHTNTWLCYDSPSLTPVNQIFRAMTFLTTKRSNKTQKIREINKQIKSTESLQKMLKCMEFYWIAKKREKSNKYNRLPVLIFFFENNIHVTENILLHISML